LVKIIGQKEMSGRSSRFHQRELAKAKVRVLHRSSKTAGSDGVLPEEREKRRPPIEHALLRPLNSLRYNFSRLRPACIEKAGKAREITIPTYQDRIVLGAASRRLERVFREKNRNSVIARSGSPGPRVVVSRVVRHLRENPESTLAALDIRRAFPSLPAEDAIALLRALGGDKRALELVQRFLSQSWSGQPGVPLGAAFSSLLLDAFLVDFDDKTREIGTAVLRFVDDLLIVTPTWRALGIAKQRVRAAIPAPLEFRDSPRVALGATRYLGWAITAEGDWWPVGGRWEQLSMIMGERGSPQEIESCARGWLHQHGLERMSVAELYRQLPVWKERNEFVEC
jgi:hypothetical protein